MIRIEFSEDEIERLRRERFGHPPGATGFASALPYFSQRINQEEMLKAPSVLEYAIEQETVPAANRKKIRQYHRFDDLRNAGQ